MPGYSNRSMCQCHNTALPMTNHAMTPVTRKASPTKNGQVQLRAHARAAVHTASVSESQTGGAMFKHCNYPFGMLLHIELAYAIRSIRWRIRDESVDRDHYTRQQR